MSDTEYWGGILFTLVVIGILLTLIVAISAHEKRIVQGSAYQGPYEVTLLTDSAQPVAVHKTPQIHYQYQRGFLKDGGLQRIEFVAESGETISWEGPFTVRTLSEGYLDE